MYDSQLDEMRDEVELEKKARRILGVSRDATLSDIKRAYWVLAMECHPDRLEGADPERFRMLAEAYEYLTTRRNGDRYNFGAVEPPRKRADYMNWWRDRFF
ncbi:MAG: J domain-containing protein [Methermicoccaceae archaeon]